MISTSNGTCFFFSIYDDENINLILCFSKRKLKIVKLTAEGYSSNIIADKLCISFHTVNTHRKKIIEKTHNTQTGGLIQFAISNSLI
ncbi:response regulator transcription factor [Pontibacter sp. 172403-2]|uniref:response regulator transcription factor n=1 Tax=Pontibacter rufus TaxID=2791028 RepID=UPI00351C2327